MQPFEVSGLWWLPEEPENKIAGFLKFHPLEGATLELQGSFGDFNLGDKFPIIVGVNADLEEITLYKCLKTIDKFTSRGRYNGHRASFSILYTFWGSHIESENEIDFEYLVISYTFAETWMRQSGFEQHIQPVESKEHVIKYVKPDTITISLPNADIYIEYAVYNSRKIHQVSFTEQVKFRIHPHETTEFRLYLTHFMYLTRSFLALGVNKPVYPRSVEGKLRNDGGFLAVYYKLGSYPAEETTTLTDDLMIYSFSDIKESIVICLNNWFRKSELLDPIYELYFDVVYSSFQPRVAFLLLAQAIETYHRRVIGGSYLTEEEYEPIRQEIAKAIPKHLTSSHKDSLKKKIEYGYEYSLRKRLKDLLTITLMPYGVVIEPLIGQRDYFISKVVATRNYLTHYEKDPATQPIEGSLGLFDCAMRLQILIQLCLLVELGLPSEKITELLLRNRTVQHYLETELAF